MSDDKKYPSDTAERFQIRLPPGLRDRIKAYAEAHGRSMNTEIVRILEREFPEPWTVSERVGQMIDLMAIVKASGRTADLERMADEFEATVAAMVSGRLVDLPQDERAMIQERFEEYQAQVARYLSDDADYDPEEYERLAKTGQTAKFVKVGSEG